MVRDRELRPTFGGQKERLVSEVLRVGNETLRCALVRPRLEGLDPLQCPDDVLSAQLRIRHLTSLSFIRNHTSFRASKGEQGGSYDPKKA